MNRFLKIIIKVLLVILVIGVAFGIVILEKPEIVINEPMLKRAQPFLASLGYGLGWSEGQIEIDSHALFEKNIDLKFKNFCVDFPKVEAKGCIDQLHVAATIKFSHFKFHMLELGPVQVASSQFLFELKPSQPSKSSRHGMFSEFIDSETNFHDLKIDLKNLKYINGESNYIVNINVDDKGTLGHQRNWELSGFLSAKDSKQKAEVAGQFKVEGENYLLSVPLKLVAKLKSEVGDKLRVNAWIDLQYLKQEAAEYQMQIDLQESNQASIESRLTGMFDGDKTTGRIHGAITAAGFKIPIGEAKECTYEVNLDGKIRLDCPFQVLPQKSLLTGLDLTQDFSLIHFVTEVNLDSENGLGTEGPWSGQVKLGVKTDGAPSVKIDGQVDSEFRNSALSAELLKNLTVRASTDIQALNFAKLVERLRLTPYAIPAPVNVLAGKIVCHLNEDFIISDLNVPFNCETQLNSSNQNLNTTLNGTFGLKQVAKKYKPNLKVNVTFEDTQVALPRFGLKGPPPIIPDSRLKKSLVAPVVDPATSMEYAVQIETASGKEVKILSNLAKTPIPLEFHVSIGSAVKPKGTVHIKNFSVELFRRQANIKYFDIYLNQNDEQPIHGMVEVHYPEYVVKIYIDGNMKEPVLRFDSVPPLSQPDIISVLLFGRPADPSNTDQSNSVSNTQAAIADKALGLASMYFLASTPVESIGYNSQSQAFTATFQLAKGTSLDVGAGDSGVKEVGVKRHLGGPWYIKTYVKNPTTDDDRSTAAFLQWVLRY